MTRNSSIGMLDLARLAMSMSVIAIVFVVSAGAERRATERDEAARDHIERQIAQVYQVLQLVIARTESCAVEIDRNGTVLWMNQKAHATLRLTVGKDVTSCMTAEGAKAHQVGFQKAMRYARSDGKPLATIPACMAITDTGEEIVVSVETWRTPKGAMAFVTPEKKRAVESTESASR